MWCRSPDSAWEPVSSNAEDAANWDFMRLYLPYGSREELLAGALAALGPGPDAAGGSAAGAAPRGTCVEVFHLAGNLALSPDRTDLLAVDCDSSGAAGVEGRPPGGRAKRPSASLREYCGTLFSDEAQAMAVVLLGRPVVQRNLAEGLKFVETYSFDPYNDASRRVTVTLGLKMEGEALSKEASGLFVYWGQALILRSDRLGQAEKGSPWEHVPCITGVVRTKACPPPRQGRMRVALFPP